jgi:hypothetical protein
MKTLWIHTRPDGESAAKPLPLPYRHLDRPLDPNIFKRQAIGEDVGRPRIAKSLGLCAMHIRTNHRGSWEPAAARCLGFILSGQVSFETGDEAVCTLGSSDVFFEDDCLSRGHRVKYEGDCRILKLLVDPSWEPRGTALPALDNVSDGGAQTVNIKRMYRAADNKAYFRSFDELFPDDSGTFGPPRAVLGFHFVSFPDGAFIDWHPEGSNNLVLVSAGELELEVSGDGSKEVFGPGSAVLAEDRVGEGHIDRMRGLTRLAMIVFEDQHLWKVPFKNSPSQNNEIPT